MDLTNTLLFNTKITTSPKERILEYIIKYLKNLQHTTYNLQPLTIFTPNPEIIMYAHEHPEFVSVLNSAVINIPDGQGIAWALKKEKRLEIPRLSGVDMVSELAGISAVKGFTIGLIGGKNGVALAAAECLKKKCIGLKTVIFGEPEVEVRNLESGPPIGGWNIRVQEKTLLNSKFQIPNSSVEQSPETIEYFRNLIKKIEHEKIDILLVALGCPKQEYFIERVKREGLRVKYARPLVLMAVGGSFDYIAGRVRRAPKFMQDAGLEWLFRLGMQPWRLGRQLKGAAFFRLSEKQ